MFISIKLSFLLLAVTFRLFFAADYVPSDMILLNCGGPPDSNDTYGRKWTTDVGSTFLSDGNFSISTADTQKSTVPLVPYMTARIFRSNSTYTFPVSPGRKFIRLYFYPNTYNNLTASNALFSVTSGRYTLLKNFTSLQTSTAMNQDYIMKEYSINVPLGTTLDITFAPDQSSSSYAFVNGIEVISHPDIYNTVDGLTLLVGTTIPFVINNNTALENTYRLNVGGAFITPVSDTGMHRSWKEDEGYIYGAGNGVALEADPDVSIKFTDKMPTYIAPIEVYRTYRAMGPNPFVNMQYNLTWIFTVDSGFYYLVRLHFCEVSDEIFKVNQRVFDIYINNVTAQSWADVIIWGGSNGVPVYKDFVVGIPFGLPQVDLWLALHPNAASKSNYLNAILNGLEIFKISNIHGNLAGVNPIPAPNIEIEPLVGKSKKKIGAIMGGVGGVFFVFCFIGLVVFLINRHLKKEATASDREIPLSRYRIYRPSNSTNSNTGASSSLRSSILRPFSFTEIKAATMNFDEKCLLGEGGFGRVYKGVIDRGAKDKDVAIKRGNPQQNQGFQQFHTEIRMLSTLSHRNLVPLIGFCEENHEMILVYDYMKNGTLREHLYNNDNKDKNGEPPLTWKQRLQICIDVANGLNYLHNDAPCTTVHRDIKTSNILLDEDWVAKISDFGLSKPATTLDHPDTSSHAKGTFGYLDPEYCTQGNPTDKSDVYSFGVVLFEILCARPAVDDNQPEERVNLAQWGLHCYNEDNFEQIMDQYLQGKIEPQCLKKVVRLAVSCVAKEGKNRPSMEDVKFCLEQVRDGQRSDGSGPSHREIEESEGGAGL